MRYARLGRSTMQVSRICIGTMHFGGRATQEESFRIMDKALDMGINFFDTANVYGGEAGRGASETIIGNWFAQGGDRRDKVVLATKVYGQMVNEPGVNEGSGISAYKVRKHAADSLRRLQTDHIDLYQVHHIDRDISLEEFWTTFDRLINDGDVLYMGTSNFPGWGLVKFQTYAWQQGMMGFISEQAQYNLLSRYPEMEVFPAAKEYGIGIIPYMPLGGGLLTGKRKTDEGSRSSQVENEYGIDLSSQQFSDYQTVCDEMGEPPHVVAIAWTLAHPAVTSAIVGPRTVEHLDGLDRAAELEIPQEYMDRLNEIFDVNKGRPLKQGEAPRAFAW